MVYCSLIWCNQFTYAKGTRSSCIDHVIYNEALAAHFNSFTSLYCVSKEFNIPPLSAKCAIAQVKGFKKWKNSNCIIFDLLRFIYHVVDVIIWDKKSKILAVKLDKFPSRKAIIKFYWDRYRQENQL